MILAEPACGVAIVSQYRANGRFVLGNDAVVARVAGGLLRDHTKARRVMVAAGDQGRTRGRAERGGVKLCVTHPGFRDPVQRGRRDDAAESATDTIPLV